MKGLRSIATIGGVLLVGFGVATAVTNPGREGYERYAAERLGTFLKTEGCQKLPFGKEQCENEIDKRETDLQNLVASNTQRQNFLLFSVYQTELSLGLPFIPSYRFKTFAAFQSFYMFEAKKQ